MTGIIDYDAGNIRSVEKALNYLGENTILTREKEQLLSADRVILPGVGSFDDAMERLSRYDLIDVIHKIVERKTPFMGVCLGLQLLFQGSEEGNHSGIGLFQGTIRRIPAAEGLKIPHIGWNSLKLSPGAKLFQGIEDGAYVYFVHSYYLKAEEEDIVAASVDYGTRIHASIEKDNVFACQFHPEKSSDVGMKLLKNFISFRKEDFIC